LLEVVEIHFETSNLMFFHASNSKKKQRDLEKRNSLRKLLCEELMQQNGQA